MNCIFIDKRRVFQKNEYVLATIFLYIDIFQTILELLEKFYNSCEPERKPVKKKTTKRGMIYTGEDDYKKQYRKESDEKDKKVNDDENFKKHHRRNSSSDLKRNLTFREKNPILEDINEEEKDEEIEIKDNENVGNDNFSEDKEENLSFKKKNDYPLNVDEEDNGK